MINNLKSKVNPCCPMHEHPLLLVPQEHKGKSLYCEAYEQHQEIPMCLNHVKCEDYENILKKLDAIISEETAPGTFPYLDGYMFSYTGRAKYEIKIVQHSNGIMDLLITNCSDMR